MIKEKLADVLTLPKYQTVLDTLDVSTELESIEWTPARLEKFKRAVANELGFDAIDLSGTLEETVDRLDKQYLSRFFGEIWKPSTDKYQYSGWSLVDLINKQEPKQVLDFGCGYNQFKGRINNLVGIDPYNNCADYMVDILDFNVEPDSFDHIIVFGSLNFNSFEDIEVRFKRLVSLLMPGGRMYFRVNPGNLWPSGPYVDIFPWNFDVAYNLAKNHGVALEKFKIDNGDRLYFEIVK
jgi:SAM-dependent methyltransferase